MLFFQITSPFCYDLTWTETVGGREKTIKKGRINIWDTSN